MPRPPDGCASGGDSMAIARLLKLCLLGDRSGGGSSESFGLGPERSLEEYQELSGVNFREQRLEADPSQVSQSVASDVFSILFFNFFESFSRLCRPSKALRGGGDSHAEDDFAEKMILTPGTCLDGSSESTAFAMHLVSDVSHGFRCPACAQKQAACEAHWSP